MTLCLLLCLSVAALAGPHHARADTQWATASHAEEEEPKKMNVIVSAETTLQGAGFAGETAPPPPADSRLNSSGVEDNALGKADDNSVEVGEKGAADEVEKALTPSSIWSLFKSTRPHGEAQPPLKTEPAATTDDNLIPVEDTAVRKLDPNKHSDASHFETPTSRPVFDFGFSTTDWPDAFFESTHYELGFDPQWDGPFASPSATLSSPEATPRLPPSTSALLSLTSFSEPSPQPVTTAKVQSQPFTTAKVQSQPFTTAKVQSQPFTTVKVQSQPITTSKVQPQPFTTAKIQSQPFTTAKVQPQPFTTTTVQPQPFTTTTVQPQPFTTTTVQPQPFTTTNVQSQPSTTATVQSQPSSLPAVKDGEEEVPPRPRLSDPSCARLPVCIEVRLPDASWAEFCARAAEFRAFVAADVSRTVRRLHPHQVVLEAEPCLGGVRASAEVRLPLFVTDESGEYDERLTEVCALILSKWAPTTFRDSVLEVRLLKSEPILLPELSSGFVAAVSISAVAGVALCMLCVLLVVMKQKLMQSQGPTPPGDAYSLDSLSINASFRRRRNKSVRSYLNHAFSDQEIPSHPLNEKSLQSILKNRELLEEEFKKIPLNMPKLDQIPEGAHVKNRYSNILPRPETRVLLDDPSGDPLKCYINANYVKGHAEKASTYIACQAPLPEGIEDFWRMVWEQQSRVIIMLTMFEENGISRCATYFPESTIVSHPPYGDFQVSLVKKEVYEFYTMSTLRLLELEKNLFRDIVHLWFTKWPDVGVPKDPSTLIYFVQQCRSYINCNAGPTVVHCSTGTGRTGVFLALDICLREYDESRSLDVLQCVSRLRLDRGGAVQNKDQYILIHEAMLEYITRLANQSQRSSIQS